MSVRSLLFGVLVAMGLACRASSNPVVPDAESLVTVSPTSSEAVKPSEATTSSEMTTPSEERSVETDKDFKAKFIAQLDAEIRQHEHALREAQGDSRVRTRLGLADLYHQRAGVEAIRDEEVMWLQRAAQTYGVVLQELTPTTADLRAHVRFGLATIHHRQGHPERAKAELRMLLKDDPQSEWAPQAILLLGDIAFESNKMDEAHTLYTRTLHHDIPAVQAYAGYKLGWVNLNLGEPKQSLSRWVAVVRLGQKHSTVRRLGEQALRDCVLAYAEVGRPQQAALFFRRLDSQRAHELLERLVQVYVDRGQEEAAARVQEHLRR